MKFYNSLEEIKSIIFPSENKMNWGKIEESSEIKSKIKEYNDLLEICIQGENIIINYNLPKEMNPKIFMILHKKILGHRLFLLQKKLRSIQNDQSSPQFKEKVKRIQSEVLDDGIISRNNILKDMGFPECDNNQNQIMLLKATQTYISDPSFATLYDNMVDIYKFFESSFCSFHFSLIFDKDPLEMNDEEIIKFWSAIDDHEINEYQSTENK